MNPPFYCKSFVQVRREEAQECRRFILSTVLLSLTIGVIVGMGIAKCENMHLVDATTPQMDALFLGIAQHK